MRSACEGEPRYKEHEGKQYCLFHYPGSEKRDVFMAGLRARGHENFNFRGFWFPDWISFYGVEFPSAADFSGANFSVGASFYQVVFEADVDFDATNFAGEADFRLTTFRGRANFQKNTFGGSTNFSEAVFGAEASFGSANFMATAYFSKVRFSEQAIFNLAKFSGASFFDRIRFSGAATFHSTAFSGMSSFDQATFGGDAKFRETTFSSEAIFGAAEFIASANFTSAKFSKLAHFGSVKFRETASFGSAKFSGDAWFVETAFNTDAYFGFVTFDAEANFGSAKFNAAACFSSANFGGKVDLTFAEFKAMVDCHEASFGDEVRFSGDETNCVFQPGSSLNLQFVRVEKPNRISFHTLTLSPHWFINVDARKFDFINVHWTNYGKVTEEIGLLEGRQVASPHRLLGIACRRLSANAEENDRYREASTFRRMAGDAQRLETWRGFDLRSLNWWYWLASGYGERPSQAMLMLLAILLVFGMLYTRVGFVRWEPRLATEADTVVARRDEVGAPLRFGRALTYSALVITLQKPEPKPATSAAQTMVLLETILGPVQAALLALAIRRKFMR